MKEFLIFYVNGNNNIIIYIDYILYILYSLLKYKTFKKNFLFFIDLLLIQYYKAFFIIDLHFGHEWLLCI